MWNKFKSVLLDGISKYIPRGTARVANVKKNFKPLSSCLLLINPSALVYKISKFSNTFLLLNFVFGVWEFSYPQVDPVPDIWIPPTYHLLPYMISLASATKFVQCSRSAFVMSWAMTICLNFCSANKFRKFSKNSLLYWFRHWHT